MKKIKYLLLLILLLPVNVFADMAAPVTNPFSNVAKFIPILLFLLLSLLFLGISITITIIVIVKYGKKNNNMDKK